MIHSCKYIFFLLLLLCIVSVEHAINLPFLSLTAVVFLYAALPTAWRNILFVFGSIILASIYFIPFWLSFAIFFCLRAPIEFLPLDRRYVDSAVVTSIILCLVAIGFWVKYPLTPGNIVLILLNSALFGAIMVYFVRQRQPQQRLGAKHAQ